MRKWLLTTVLWMLFFVPAIHAAPKTHTVTFGPVMKVKLFVGPNENKALDIKVRALYSDGKLKEFTTGDIHEITDRQFAIQRAYRVNDSLPQDDRNLPRWRWQRGGWLLVDRITAHVTQLRLPDFDPFYSDVSWFRDYAAYCGTPDGEKLYAMVAQLGVRKPVLKKMLRQADPTGDDACARPQWQRQPSRVTFELKDGQKLSFTVRSREVDLTTPSDSADSDDE